jgi:hypothetical protein
MAIFLLRLECMQRAMAERNGRIPGRHSSGWAFALCRFLSGALFALVTLGNIAFAHAETINHMP